jgi:hypothetical protein
MMTRQVETMGDFVKRFERSDEGRDAMRTVEFVMNLDDGEVERAETARQWREFNVSPLALAEVEVLADAVFSAYQWALGGAGEETYGLLRDEARDALRELQHLASELGLYECAQALDPEQPLTPSEVMVDAGYAEISDDGRIKLTDLGEAVARSVEKDPGDPENN